MTKRQTRIKIKFPKNTYDPYWRTLNEALDRNPKASITDITSEEEDSYQRSFSFVIESESLTKQEARDMIWAALLTSHSVSIPFARKMQSYGYAPKPEIGCPTQAEIWRKMAIWAENLPERYDDEIK